MWLSRYLRPKEIGFDNGFEFKMEFQDLCSSMGLKQCPNNAWNPQSNTILERIHQVLADGLVTFDLENKPIDVNEDDPFDEYLTAVSYTIRSSYYQTHGHSPAQLVFGRDMFSPVSVDVDWNAIREKKQLRINKNNNRENQKGIPHIYKKGDYVTLQKPGILQHLAIPREEPFKVMKHNNNGSIVIAKAPAKFKNVNVRRATPYNRKN